MCGVPLQPNETRTFRASNERRAECYLAALDAAGLAELRADRLPKLSAPASNQHEDVWPNIFST